MEVKVDKRGKILIPKILRDKHNFNSGITLEISDDGSTLILKPYMACSACDKALPEELYERGACATCTPKEKKIIQIY